MTRKENDMTDKPKQTKKTNATLVRPDEELQERIDAYHEIFECAHGVRVPRQQILLKLIRDGLDYHNKPDASE
jgi:hypothetical protein